MILWLVLAAILMPRAGQEDRVLVRQWIADVRSHQPGTVDPPLVEVAALLPRDFETINRAVRDALKPEPVSVRNDILRRAALVHSDIALLLPRQAVRYVSARTRDERFVFSDFGTPTAISGTRAGAADLSRDGEYVSTGAETGHWEMARRLLDGIAPRPGADDYVRLWYRAVAAHFEASNLLGTAREHLTRALNVLPDDPIILFYAGALHEAYASRRVQSAFDATPAWLHLRVPAARDELRLAERLLERAIAAQAPLEARLRRARVLGQLGRHEDAAATLRDLEPQLTEPRLQYLAALFLGTEEEAVDRIGPAQQAFERAAAYYPTAQSPLIGLAELCQRAGDREAALVALDRIHHLPGEAGSRVDPWTTYFRSYAHDAAAQLVALRGWFDRAGRE